MHLLVQFHDSSSWLDNICSNNRTNIIFTNCQNHRRSHYLASVFIVPLDLQILDQFQPHILDFAGLKFFKRKLSATNELRSLHPLIIKNSYSQVLCSLIFDNKIKVFIPNRIQLVVLNRENNKILVIKKLKPRSWVFLIASAKRSLWLARTAKDQMFSRKVWINLQLLC